MMQENAASHATRVSSRSCNKYQDRARRDKSIVCALRICRGLTLCCRLILTIEGLGSWSPGVVRSFLPSSSGKEVQGCLRLGRKWLAGDKPSPDAKNVLLSFEPNETESILVKAAEFRICRAHPGVVAQAGPLTG